MTTISKTAALREARAAVGSIIRRGPTDYVVYGPWRTDKPWGPSTEMRRGTYPAAVIMRTHWIVSIALALLGIDDPDIDEWLTYAAGSGDARTLLNRALAKARVYK